MACSTEDIPAPSAAVPSPEVTKVSEYHEKIRTKPYPMAESTIYVNPAPLIVPQSMKTGTTIRFQLSQDPTFESENTITSSPRQWCMFSPHKQLPIGRWYWRFCNDDGDWSESNTFEISGDEDVFATPAFRVFLDNAPKRHPRLNCFIDAASEIYHENAYKHPEYRMLLSRAEAALDLSLEKSADLYKNYSSLMNSVKWLSDAFMVTADEKYADKLVSILETMVAAPPSDRQLYSENFATSAITYSYTAIYDLLFHALPDALKEGAEKQMIRALEHFTIPCIGYEENHIFDNHFWQQNMRVMFQTAFALFDHPNLSPRVLPLLEYLFELWCTRAPATGFSRDGLWHNGVGYMTANIETLAYMPKLLSYITRFDFLSHPWYQNAGKSLCYSCPTASMGVGFGDQSEKFTTTNRLYPAFADFLAAETGDGYAGWYAAQNETLLQGDYVLRLYRMTRLNNDYSKTKPENVSSMIVYDDAGEVAMHSNVGDTANDLALAFRSSGFGSGSHTTASQNAFNIYFGGSPVFHSSGYYQNFSDAHNLMSYRHSRAHNTVLVNGIGQPYTTKAYGALVRNGGGATLSYALGDASYAYCGVSDDTMWVKAFEDAGIDQTPENGFGVTPLTRYRRHIAMLEDDAVLIYDELEASEAVDWDWLLHSDYEICINEEECCAEVEASRSKAKVSLFSRESLQLSITNEFRVPPAVRGNEYQDQWHFTARVMKSPKVRILAVIQNSTAVSGLPILSDDDGNLEIGDWRVSAQLNADFPPSLEVVNVRKETGLSYGNQPFSVGDCEYKRSYYGSTILVDLLDGKVFSKELVDVIPANSRAK